MKRFVFFAPCVLILFLFSASWAIEREYLESPGLQGLDEKATDFTVVGPDGRRIALAALEGRVVILHFWATWCKPCKEEFPAFERLYEETKGRGVVFLPISIDKDVSRDELNAFAKELGASFPVYLAREGDVTDRYWAWGVPATYFIDKRGWLVARALGPRDWASAGVKNLIEALLR